MISKSDSWWRWAGERSDLVEAIRVASDAVTEWTGLPAEVQTEVTFADGLTETSTDASYLERLARADVAVMTSARFDVRPSRGAHADAVEAALSERLARIDEGEDPYEVPEPLPLPDVSVQFRIRPSFHAMSFEVQGDERARVVGLAARLTSILGRGAPMLSRIPTDVVHPVGVAALNCWCDARRHPHFPAGS